jgi:hypothetical protein
VIAPAAGVRLRSLQAMIVVAAIGCSAGLALAEERGEQERADKFDSEHMFGFTTGSDIGEPHSTEVESETQGHICKRAGSYADFGTTFEYKSTLNDALRISPGASVTYHDISGVPGLDDRRQLAFQGLSVEFSYRFLDRQKAPFGFTLNVVPQWNRIDDVSGAPVEQYGAEIALLMDRELVADRLYGAFNVIYDPETTRVRGTGLWERDTTAGLAAALTAHIASNVFVGLEARYLRKYEGLSLDEFAGHALYVGPTFYIKVSDRWSIAGAWNVQAAGHAVGDPRAFDLTNFDRHQLKLRLSAEFD